MTEEQMAALEAELIRLGMARRDIVASLGAVRSVLSPAPQRPAGEIGPTTSHYGRLYPCAYCDPEAYRNAAARASTEKGGAA